MTARRHWPLRAQHGTTTRNSNRTAAPHSHQPLDESCPHLFVHRTAARSSRETQPPVRVFIGPGCDARHRTGNHSELRYTPSVIELQAGRYLPDVSQTAQSLADNRLIVGCVISVRKFSNRRPATSDRPCIEAGISYPPRSMSVGAMSSRCAPVISPWRGLLEAARMNDPNWAWLQSSGPVSFSRTWIVG